MIKRDKMSHFLELVNTIRKIITNSNNTTRKFYKSIKTQYRCDNSNLCFAAKFAFDN